MHTLLDTSFRPHSDSIVDYLCPRQTVLSRETSSSVTCASVACSGFAHSLLATKNAPGRSEGIWPAKYTGMEQLQTEAKKFDASMASAPDVDVETTYDCIPPAQNFNGGVWFLEYVVPTWMAKIKFEAAAAAVTIVRLLRDNKHLKEGHADHAMAKISLDLSSTFQDEPVRLLLDELRRSLGKMPMRKPPEIYRNLISTMTVGPARPEEERERRIDIAYTFKYKFPVGVDGLGNTRQTVYASMPSLRATEKPHTTNAKAIIESSNVRKTQTQLIEENLLPSSDLRLTANKALVSQPTHQQIMDKAPAFPHTSRPLGLPFEMNALKMNFPPFDVLQWE
ncbi:predicted protein [Postia placenta Mad-698-R]|uniref:Uncharacterized protein n=1 Tax=Postia placenta MAD-698-R-SB12 TaxID=670580 RepID=A0A1X6MKU4_9APHY|nr:hypothetical protein POSPLADRAFT_1050345 [Postia placenta MAD-698-R-SB12]EED84658.1 predicted protein [Postia placenta Mad-698-R]OSX56909.1 hypothetical protein POSPLADRAFT_1050345 [Postia placenta MAD-698-R-SB12]